MAEEEEAAEGVAWEADASRSFAEVRDATHSDGGAPSNLHCQTTNLVSNRQNPSNAITSQVMEY